MLRYEEATVVVLVIRVQGTHPQEFVLMRPKDAPHEYQLPSTMVDCHESPESAAADLLRRMIGIPADGVMQHITVAEERHGRTVSLRCSITRAELEGLGELSECTFEAIPDSRFREIGLSRADRLLMHKAHRDDSRATA